MRSKPVLLSAALLILSTFAVAEPQSDKLEGKWKLILAKSGGRVGLELAPSFQTIEIKGKEITMNGERTLQFRIDEKTDPFQIYVLGEQGGHTSKIYSGIYRFFKGDLVICVDAGDDAPREFEAGDSDSSFLLRFGRVDL